MKNLKSFGSLILLTWCLILVPLATAPLVGCKTSNRSSYRVVGTVQVSADAAMSAWGSYVRQFPVSIESEQAVKTAFERYRSTMLVVATAGKALAEADTQDSRQKLDIAMAAAASALGNLTSLIQSFGVKVK